MIILQAKNDVITLVGEPIYQKINGFKQMTEAGTRKDVFASIKSVKCNEFYLAHSEGIKADIIFSILVDDYSGEKDIEVETKTYRVIRTYRTNEYDIELTCTEV